MFRRHTKELANIEATCLKEWWEGQTGRPATLPRQPNERPFAFPDVIETIDCLYWFPCDRIYWKIVFRRFLS